MPLTNNNIFIRKSHLSKQQKRGEDWLIRLKYFITTDPTIKQWILVIYHVLGSYYSIKESYKLYSTEYTALTAKIVNNYPKDNYLKEI